MFREIIGKVHLSYAENDSFFEVVKCVSLLAKSFELVLAEILRSERCKGMQVL